MARVLYLEDELFLGRIVRDSLESRGFEMHLVSDGANLMQAFEDFNPDICVFDIMVPNIDGYELATLVRKINKRIPIIFLSAKSQTKDVLKGFDAGGNDYLKKPFSMEELIVRIENLLSMSNKNQRDEADSDITIGSFVFRPTKFELVHEDEIVSLSHRENELLKLMSSKQNQKIERRAILKQLWGDDSLYNSRNLDVYIRKLRVYFEKDKRIRLKTLRGVGYYLDVGK